jgi:hypothetical protein
MLSTYARRLSLYVFEFTFLQEHCCELLDSSIKSHMYALLDILFFIVKFMSFNGMCVCCSGIGIVNAIEVVTAFPEEDGIKKFRDWI